MVQETADDIPILLERLIKGDTTAWRELVERYSGFLLAVARRTFSGYGVRPEPEDCEDAVGEVWKNLVENNNRLLHECLQRASLLPTLQVLARHRTIDIMRRRRRTVSLDDAPPGQEPASPAPPPELPREALAAALAKLNARERTLVNLFFMQGKKYREIATLTGIPQNSIGPTLGRAIARLREAMKE